MTFVNWAIIYVKYLSGVKRFYGLKRTMNYQTLTQRLSQVDHFRGVPEADYEEIASSGKFSSYPVGSYIFYEGEPCSGLFVLLQGQVSLCKWGPRGQKSILDVLGPVVMFNEVAACDGGPNPVTAMAIQECATWQINPACFQSLVQRIPQIGMGLLRVMAARNRLLISHYEDLSFRPVLSRFAKLLLELSQMGQASIDRAEHSNHELAARTGTVPEAISRSIQFLRQNGWIASNRASLTILRPERMIELAEIEPIRQEI
jgi:CRP-like cAMP-binding protein